MAELHAFLTELLNQQNVSSLTKHLPGSLTERVCQALNHGIDIESIVCLLLGTMSTGGERAGKEGRMTVDQHPPTKAALCKALPNSLHALAKTL
jgi:hypothetical protein